MAQPLKDKPARRSEPAAGATEAPTIKDLISYRLNVLVTLLGRGAAAHYRREFGVSVGEWRTIALLGAFEPSSLNELARAANLDKGQMSRVVAALIAQGLVQREEDVDRGRTVSLTLTRKGKALYRRQFPHALERNAALLACLTPQEQNALDSILDKFTAIARALYRAETGRDTS